MMMSKKEQKYLTLGFGMAQDDVKEKDGFRLETVAVEGCKRHLLLREIATDKVVLRFSF